MKCARYERMLSLHREGELDSEDLRLLRSHLATCTRCAGLAASFARADSLLAKARLASPRPADADRLTHRILMAVDLATSPRVSAVSTLLDRLAEMLERPPVRFSAAGFVCTVTAAFLLQQASLFMSVRSLEQRAASRPAARPTATLAYRLESQGVEGLEELRSALEQRLPLGRQGERLVITADALRDYESMLRELAGPFSDSPLGARIDRARLERVLQSVVGSISVSLAFQSSEG